MKKEQIQELLTKFENACYLFKGIECWSARELQVIFNYTEWRNFLKVVLKASEACQHAGESIEDHFVDVNKMIDLAKGAWVRIMNNDQRIMNSEVSRSSKNLIPGKIHLSRNRIFPYP